MPRASKMWLPALPPVAMFILGYAQTNKGQVMISPWFRKPLRVSPSLLCPVSGPGNSIPAARKQSLSPDVPSRAPGLGLGVL